MIGIAYESFVNQTMINLAIAEQRDQALRGNKEMLGWFNEEKVINCEYPELFGSVMPVRVSLLRRIARWIRGIIARFSKVKNPAQNTREVSAWNGVNAPGAVRAQR